MANLAVRHVVLIVLAILNIIPVILVISTALKTDEDVAVDPFGLFTSFSLDSMVRAWVDGEFNRYLLNSFLLSVPSTVLIIVISTMAGYTFARLPFFGRSFLFYLVVLGLLVPFFTYMIPLYFQLRSIGLLDTLLGAILVLDLDRDLVRHLLHAGVLLRPARGTGAGRPDRRLLRAGRSSPG